MSTANAPTGTLQWQWRPRPVTGLAQGSVRYREDAKKALDAAVLPRAQERRVDFTAEVAELMDTSALHLLAELSEAFDMSWSSVAAAVGVSVPALRKWRLGQPITEPNLLALATLVSVSREIRARGIARPAEWMERWIWPDVPVRRLQLVSLGHSDVLRALAHRVLTPIQALDEAVPRWRERYLIGESRVEFDERGRPTIYVG